MMELKKVPYYSKSYSDRHPTFRMTLLMLFTLVDKVRCQICYCALVTKDCNCASFCRRCCNALASDLLVNGPS
ncbi:hypothetical protein C9415_13590 [Kluyvera sp. Nf5]|nr:hypothetical protein C9415_13590 [Kluyvera sp. Nf5]